MAAAVQGTAHIFGVQDGTSSFTISNARVTGVNLTKRADIDDQTVDETGNVIETRLDSGVTEGTLTIRITSSYTVSSWGETIAVSNLADTDLNDTYEIVSVEGVYQSRGYVEVTYNVRNHAGITYS